jgi:hypothetical protein
MLVVTLIPTCRWRRARAVCATMTSGTRNWQGMWYVARQKVTPDRVAMV